MSIDTLQVLEGQPFLYLYDAIAKLREHNSPEINDNMDGVIEIELDIDMRTDKMVMISSSVYIVKFILFFLTTSTQYTCTLLLHWLQTRMKANFTRSIKLPHHFDEGRQATVLAFCEVSD